MVPSRAVHRTVRGLPLQKWLVSTITGISTSTLANNGWKPAKPRVRTANPQNKEIRRWSYNNSIFLTTFRINARFLWKRIPQIVKTENEHFTHLHKVYICQWQNDIGGFFTAINQQWPTNIVDIMNELKGNLSTIDSVVWHKHILECID